MSELITSQRLILRSLLKTYVDSIFVLRSSPIVNKYIARDLEIDKNDAMAFIEKILGVENKGNEYWAIQLKGNKTCIGTICLWNFSEDRKMAEVGYDLLPEFHKKGIMHEALQSILSYGFHNLKLDVIEAYTHKGNTASINLLNKNDFVFQPGMKDEGFPNNIFFKLIKKPLI